MTGSLTLAPVGPVTGAVEAPASKSVSNRLLVLAALASGSSRLSGLLVSDDTLAMAEGLRSFGAGIEDTGAGGVVVVGTGGQLQQPAGVVAAGLSGTTLRFLACLTLLAPGPVTLDGEPPLRRRPLAPLLSALGALGAKVDSSGGFPPVTITPAGLPGGRVVVDAAASSQFVTGLLLVAPFANARTTIAVENLGAGGYVELTVAAMRRWGAEVAATPAGYEVAADRRYGARDETAEYDASAAAHLFALALATGGSLTVSNATQTLQPDAGVVEVFGQMGAEVSQGPSGLSLSRPGALRGVQADMSATPDQVPTLAALGALAEGTTRLTGVSVARGHETDRVAAIATELGRLGASVEIEDDALVVAGGRRLHGGVVSTYEDHRMAMALSSVAAVVPGVTILDPGCVGKTYPNYWRDLEKLGLAGVSE
ncbi:MAG TPA: 3-phosphoshikimate 1-carboxyvinyltransferase [Acidimicrobiales bacterium]|nr:3-phosphoshikimate 1-carboxyvinyltransferase [Acidimicrobiales bacterium]